MMERVKTLLLCALVVTSLLQSYLLAYSNPKLEPINQNDYVQTERLNGTPLELEDLIFPETLVLHFGNQQHSVLYPGDLFYPTILEKVKQRYFEGFRKTNLYAAGVNWDDARNKQQGIELRFGHGVPFSVLQKLLQFKGDVPNDTDMITRIWIIVKENKEDVRTYFFTDNVNTVYEVIKADFTAKDLEEYLNNANYPLYHSTNGDYYLPDQPLSMTAYTFQYTQFTSEQLKQSLFVDPGITRNLKETDGSIIYTDGKRGLQLSGDLHWMSYSDPVAPTDSKFDVRENLLTAIQFINQHGGWNGKFGLKEASMQGTGGQTFDFRQYYGRYPIVGQRPESFGSIRLTIQKGTVSNYERSTILIDERPSDSKATSLEGGETLDNRLKAYPKRGSILTVFPAYRTIVQEKTLELRPVWAVELRDGSMEFLP
jgi:regulatory protein YycH of two-component signal transduction system YycFG